MLMPEGGEGQAHTKNNWCMNTRNNGLAYSAKTVPDHKYFAPSTEKKMHWFDKIDQNKN